MKTIEEIYENMDEEMPFHIHSMVKPYILDAMRAWEKQQVSIAVEKFKPTKIQLQEAYNLGLYRGKCQILYPKDQKGFISFEEYFQSINTQILEELKGGECE